jgi:hypothetical protein
MTRITDRRVFLAILAALHFVAAPCVMATTAATGEEPCEHCGAGRDLAPCASTATDPGNDDGAPAPGRYRLPDPPGVIALLPVPVVSAAPGLSAGSPAECIGRATGRHTGDPPFNVLYGKFLN